MAGEYTVNYYFQSSTLIAAVAAYVRGF